MQMISVSRLIAAGTLLTAIFAGAQSAAAAPTMSVAGTGQIDDFVEVRVTGSGFTPNVWHELDVTYAGSNSSAGTWSFLANGSGQINATEWLPYNNACRLDMYMWDLSTFNTTSSVSLTVPYPCQTPSISVAMHNNEPDATKVSGVNFTPPGPGESDQNRAGSWVWDFTTGESWNNETLPVFSDGTTGFHRHWGADRCGHTLLIYMHDLTTQVWSNGVTYTLCP
jgi:hypothetical protein